MINDGPFTKKSFLRGGLVLLVFTAVLLWHATHSLFLLPRAARLGLSHKFGLYLPEKTPGGMDFVWTRKSGGFSLRIEKAILEVPLRAAHPDIGKRPVLVRVFLVWDSSARMKKLGEIWLQTNDWTRLQFSVGEALGKNAVLIFKTSRIWNPWKMGVADDRRDLGIAVGSLGFKGRAQAVSDKN